jgi:aspartate/methionine/tyrosine aminotransferase
MSLPTPFQLERYFARNEFNAPYQLSASDCESLSLKELLSLADPETRALWETLSLGYTESPGHPLLRTEIAGTYAGIAADQVLVAAPEEAIFIAMHVLLSPGDEVIVLAPAYQSLHEIARSIGARVLDWPLLPAQDGPQTTWRLDLDGLRARLSPRTKLIVINFPHNPTGFLPTRAEFESILEAARAKGCAVFADEMYRGLEYTPADRLPAVCDLYEDGISLSGMSKAYALPGLRIGWLATRQAGLPARLQAFKDYTTICSSAPSEILALAALRAREHILSRNREIIRANRAAAERFFGERAGFFRWAAPCAGSVAFPIWRGPGTVEDFCGRMVEQQGVMVVPGSLFAFPGNHFRVGLGRRSFAAALARVSEGLAGESASTRS